MPDSDWFFKFCSDCVSCSLHYSERIFMKIRFSSFFSTALLASAAALCGGLVFGDTAFGTRISETSNAGVLASEGFTPLFNGLNLSGWKVRGGFAAYSVEDGMIVGKCAPGTPGNTFLCTEKEYSNFQLRLEVKYVVMGNSGVQFRSHSAPAGERERVFGYQCEIADRVAIGQIYDEGRRAWSYSSKFRGLKRPDDWFPADAVRAYRKNDWNLVEIQCVGSSIRTWINGVPCADMIDILDASGFIGLQVHAGSAGTLQWRNLEIKELPETPWKALAGSVSALKDFTIRGIISETDARNLCGEKYGEFIKKSNCCAASVIGDRTVLNLNGKELFDIADPTEAKKLRAKLAEIKDVSWEVIEFTPEMKKMAER